MGRTKKQQWSPEIGKHKADDCFVWGVITAKILFQILLCRTSVVYKFFAENIRTEIEQTE